MTRARRIAAVLVGVTAGLCVVLLYAVARGQDAGPARGPVVRAGRVDTRPRGLWAVPKPPDCPVADRSCSDPEAEIEAALVVPEPAARTAHDERPAAAPEPARRRMEPRAERQFPWWGWACVALGVAILAYGWRRRGRRDPGPVYRMPADRLATADPAGESKPWKSPKRPPSRLSEIQRAEARQRAGEMHRASLRRRVAALGCVDPSDVRTEPNPSGQGWRAWLGPAWDSSTARASWSLGGEPAALSRLLGLLVAEGGVLTSLAAQSTTPLAVPIAPLLDPPDALEGDSSVPADDEPLPPLAESVWPERPIGRVLSLRRQG